MTFILICKNVKFFLQCPIKNILKEKLPNVFPQNKNCHKYVPNNYFILLWKICKK